MKIEIYCNHLIIHALNHFGDKQFHVYQENGFRIIDSATTIEQTKQLINELITENN